MRRSINGVVMVGVLALLPACGSPDEKFLQSDLYATEDGRAEGFVWRGCIPFDSPTSSLDPSSRGTPEGERVPFTYGLRYDWTDDGLRFSVTDGAGKLIASSSYTAKFVEAGEPDQVNARVSGGSIRTVNRGVKECAALDPSGSGDKPLQWGSTAAASYMFRGLGSYVSSSLGNFTYSGIGNFHYIAAWVAAEQP